HVKQATADPTVDVAVATLFAQTQQAASPDMTQVVATAFSAAQTATAEAGETDETGETSATDEATPEVTPEVTVTPQPTLDVSTFTAETVQTYDLVAGPANTGAYLAP